ncbi:MAG: IS4 family transposase, partial [Leadbetterella sp.]
TILILKYLKSIAKYDWHLSNLVAFIRLNIFVKIDLQTWLDKPFEVLIKKKHESQQGDLFYNSA